MGRHWNGHKLNELPMKCKYTDSDIYSFGANLKTHAKYPWRDNESRQHSADSVNHGCHIQKQAVFTLNVIINQSI